MVRQVSQQHKLAAKTTKNETANSVTVTGQKEISLHIELSCMYHNKIK